jgi:C1A family cysteine protease
MSKPTQKIRDLVGYGLETPAKSMKITYKTNFPPGRGGMRSPMAEDVTKNLVLGAINTQINLDSLSRVKLPSGKGLSAQDKKKEQEMNSLPKNFSWHKVKGRKGKQISKPPNQLKCGSCWAVSSASVINDNLIVSNVVMENPDISPTYALSCFYNGETPVNQGGGTLNKCNGGNVADLMKEILKNGGMATTHCLDYSWCTSNEMCNGDATTHFNAADLQNLVPLCGCIVDDVKHHLFPIDSALSFYIDADKDKVQKKAVGLSSLSHIDKVDPSKPSNAVKNFRKNAQYHIYKHGPVVGCFIVYSNFREGLFTDVDDLEGVYLENYTYEKGKDDKIIHTYIDPNTQGEKNPTNKENFLGGHAVAIVGWGRTDKKIQYAKDKEKAYVNFWVVRNSWSELWGWDGYCKVAMYPFNLKSQFDKQVRPETPQGTITTPLGGMILIKVSKQPTNKVLPSDDSYSLLQELSPDDYLHEMSYYSREDKVKKVSKDETDEKPIFLGWDGTGNKDNNIEVMNIDKSENGSIWKISLLIFSIFCLIFSIIVWLKIRS